MTTPKPIPYRTELDGLRAIAVLAVLGYHAGYNDFAGGFMGVDVFLTLSGYLITQQISAALSEGRFALIPFWLRRARRLMPAMLPVLAFALISALILKGDQAFGEFMRHFLSAGLFFSNYQFLSEADYFARASDTNLLLHTWSLSLEWQFYLVMPLLLLATSRLRRAPLALFLGLIALASLLLAEILIGSGRNQWAFYGVLPRFWEFAAGGVIALLPRLPLPSLLPRSVGLALVLWAIFSDPCDSFPGLGAIWAVAGTALILWSLDEGIDPARWLLQTRPLRWIGLRSYAIYLIHWPLFVSVTPTAMNRSEGTLSVALLVSILLGHLIYRYVETPARQGRLLADLSAMRRGLLATAAGIIGFWALLSGPPATALRDLLPLQAMRAAMNNVDAARAEYLQIMTELETGEGRGAELLYCTFDDITGLDEMLDCLAEAPEGYVLMIGDSHGRDTLMSLQLAYPQADLVMVHQSSCVPASYDVCFLVLPELLQHLAATGELDRVILSSRWGYGQHAMAVQVLAQLEELGARVLVIGPGPTYELHIESHALSAAFAGGDLRQSATLGLEALAFDVATADRELAAETTSHGADYLNRFAIFCDTEACRVANPEGAYLFSDNEHLTPAGFERFAAALRAHEATRALLAP